MISPFQVAYPLALLYRYLRPRVLRSSSSRHLYFASTGLFFCFFNFGIQAFHSILAVVVTYLLVRCFPGSTVSIVVGFVFHVSYLTVGYAMVASESYDVKWTTAYCVLCLRHIGLLFDLRDGMRSKGGDGDNSPAESASLPAPLDRPPTFVQLVAHTYFFGGFLVGPQFPMARYLNFIEDFSEKSEMLDTDANQASSYNQEKQHPSTALTALQRLVMGLLFVAVFQISGSLVPQSYMLTTEFLEESSFVYKMNYILIWGKLVLYKYVGIWLIAEGSCILSGWNSFHILYKFFGFFWSLYRHPPNIRCSLENRTTPKALASRFHQMG